MKMRVGVERNAILVALVFFISTLAVISTASVGRAAEFEASEESEHFVIYYHVGYEQQADSLLSAHENCYTFVTEFIGYEPQSKTKIYLCSTPEEIVEVGGRPGATPPPPGTPTGSWSNGSLNYYYTFGGTAVVHEFVHAVESQLLQFERPRWWIEGLACYVTYKFAGAPSPAGLYSDQLSEFTGSILYNNPPFKSLGELRDVVVLDAFGYMESMSVFLFIGENYGELRVENIIQAARDTESIPAAFQASLGVSFPAFEAEWRNCLTQSVVAIAEAQTAVSTAERDGRTMGLENAKARLSEAVSSFNRGKFLEARAKAGEAENLAAAATVGAPSGVPEVVPEEKINWPLYVGMGVAIAILVSILLVLKRK